MSSARCLLLRAVKAVTTVLLAAALAVTLVGCGSKSARAQYVDRLNAMCEDFAAREQQIGEPGTPEDLAARGDRIVVAFEQTILQPLQTVKAPPEVAPQAVQLRVLARQQRDVLRGLAEAGRAGDVTKVRQLAARNTTLNAQAGRIAHDLEADSCAS
jgi:outer membrane murein-binding lipoprotein Lpp